MEDKNSVQYVPFSSSSQSSRLLINRNFRHFIIGFAYFLLFALIVFYLFTFSPFHSPKNGFPPVELDRWNLYNLPEVLVPTTSRVLETQKNCTYYNCFDVYRCSHSRSGKISVYIYPLVEFVDEEDVPITKKITEEFYNLLLAIKKSEYSTNDPNKACILIPSIDLLNQNRISPKDVSKALSSLEHWNDGKNHLLFNMLPGSMPKYLPYLEVESGYAMVTSGGFSSVNHRMGFDISVPVYSPLAAQLDRPSAQQPRPWLIISSQSNIHEEFQNVVQSAAAEQSNFLVLGRCASDPLETTMRCRENQVFSYPEILMNGTFCLVLRGARLGQPSLMDCLSAGSIPVIASDLYVLPYSEVIDWKRAAVKISEDDLAHVMDIVTNISEDRAADLRRNGRFIYAKYFASMEKIALTALSIINERIFPSQRLSYAEWNDPPQTALVRKSFILPMGPPRSQGFTAVVLTYDRMESLFRVLERLSKVPSLAKMVVVWNNQQKDPPPISDWPRLPKPLLIVRTKQNQLSNRFYPYPEIETDAILAMDDDIVMLTTDELEFGFEVWRQFPDRIVGYPSRTHVWDSGMNRWKYESEWTNNISMVLTGAAFYHRHYNYAYSTSMPGEIKTWVDDHMNCEDIAMNFLVANITGKAPIKVAPRKKFKCPECVNMEMLSVDQSHMTERSECINRFAQIYGQLPLQSVEFRADPVLYKDNLPDVFKRFKDVGSLYPYYNQSAAFRCSMDDCLLPDCFCGGDSIPDEIPVRSVPQIVLLTFDDGVNDRNEKLYDDLFKNGRTNPNGCPISATFYVSHEWTDYSLVRNLYAAGHEIASHTISHSFGQNFTAKQWAREAVGQRDLLAAYAGVRVEDVRGLRAPYLSIGGDQMFKVLHDTNFTYDSSMPILENKVPSWPYTLDYKMPHECVIPPCPINSYPGVWEVPMVMWNSLGEREEQKCSMGDDCYYPDDAYYVKMTLMHNFERHYKSNRAPFPVYFHSTWFDRGENYQRGFTAFLDEILKMDDVWVVTSWKALQWMRDPTPLSKIFQFQPFSCNYPVT
uniref:Exostosin-2 n=1 Tax=Evadne anonyx TaxID=141404 RepID=A0A9N6ZF66_9CRUS|nr:EOG090X01LY [Evadne anonyx]